MELHNDDLDGNEKPSSKCLPLKLRRLSAVVAKPMVAVSVAVTVMGLYLIPSITFFIPLQDFNRFNFARVLRSLNASEKSCSTSYLLNNNSICYEDLSSLLALCSPSSPGQVLVPISGQNELEQYLIVIFSVAFFPTEFSRGCDLILRHFFCFYGYGACDGTRTLQWTRESCQLITEDLCARDWELLQAFTSNTGLPVCDNLPSSTKDCEVDYLLNITKFHNGTTSAMEEPGEDLNCSEFFYYNRMNGICRVECNWNPLRTSAQLSVIIGSLFSAIAILVSPIYILLAFTVQRSWSKFPVIYYMFMVIDAAVFAILSIIQQPSHLYCTHQDLFFNLIQNKSPGLCYFVGILIQYIQIQFAYWLLFYAIVVWWGLSYPFSYKKAKDEGKFNYILAATILIGLIMPSLVLLLVVDGFYSTNIAFNACSARNPTHFYIVSTLHFSLVMYFCTLFLLLNIYALVMVYIRRKTESRERNTNVYSIAALKLLVVALFFMCVTIFTLTYQARTTRLTPDVYSSMFLDYGVCESYGRDPSRNCNQFLDTSLIAPYFRVAIASIVVEAVIPLVIITLNSNLTSLKNKTRTLWDYFGSKAVLSFRSRPELDTDH